MTVNSSHLSAAQRSVQQNFQRGFRKYNDNAHVQKHIARQLVDFFAQANDAPGIQNALEIGCGTGFLTRELQQRFSIDHWTINDLVSDCEAHITPILNNSDWRFLPGAIEATPLLGHYDLIASASVFQWIADTPALLKRLADALKPGGWLILSSFGPDNFRELREFGNQHESMSYFDSSDWQGLMPHNLASKHIHQELKVAKFRKVRDLLMHLRNTGVNANTQQQWSREKLASFERDYTHGYSDSDQNVCLTYAPVYVIAQKGSA